MGGEDKYFISHCNSWLIHTVTGYSYFTNKCKRHKQSVPHIKLIIQENISDVGISLVCS